MILRRSIFLLVLVALAGCSDETLQPTGTVTSTTLGVEVGDVAPNFVLYAPDSSQVSLADYRGTMVYVDFWASWCGPCIAKLPELEELWEEYKDRDFVIIGVSQDYTWSAWKTFVDRGDGGGWVHGYDDYRNADSHVATRWDVRFIPTTFLIDTAGRVVGRDLSLQQVRAFLQ